MKEHQRIDKMKFTEDSIASDSRPGFEIHYAALVIEPAEYILRNDIGFCEGNVIKYVSRWRYKNGVQDLIKARRYLDLLIDNEASKNNV